MALFKKKITEKDAAIQFASIKLKECEDNWAGTYATLQECLGEKFKIEDEEMAVVNWFLAKIALHLQSLNNIFPANEADRIRKWYFKSITSPEIGDYIRAEIKEYEEAYVQSTRVKQNPISAICFRLLYKWIGTNIADFEYEFAGKKTGTIGLRQEMLLSYVLTEGIGWKNIKDNYNIVNGGSPE